jgi:DNA-binding response OmpR family regulator
MCKDRKSTDRKPRALILSTNATGVAKVSAFLRERGIEAVEVDSLERCVIQAKSSPPDLLIAEDDITSNIGLLAIRELLRISWMVSSILVSDLDETEIHDRAEGLGILGNLRVIDDLEELDRLLDDFDSLRPS